MIRRSTIAVIIFTILCSSMALFSYRNARNKADEIIKPFLKDELYYYGTEFQPVMFLRENNKIQEWWGPSWWISYDHQTHMLTGPISIRINLLGNITATNPNNLLEEIIPNRLKSKANQNQ